MEPLEAIAIALRTPKDISTEEYREYVFYSKKNETFIVYKIMNPRSLFVSDSGSHRVVDDQDKTHWVSGEFVAIRWKSDPVVSF